MASGMLCGALGGCCINPVEVLKTRMQAQGGLTGHQHSYSGPLEALASLVREEGVAGCFKGVGVSTLRGILGPGSQLVAYNEFKSAAVARGLDGSAAFGSASEPDFIVSSWLELTYSSLNVIQLGFALVLPLFAELWLEFDLMTALSQLISQLLAGNWFFSLFRMQTNTFHFGYGLTYGKAAYVATGRGYAMESRSLVALYTTYAESHVYLGVELVLMLSIYQAFQEDAAVAGLTTWGPWIVAVSLLFAPWIFNPLGWTLEVVSDDFWLWVAWMNGRVDPSVGKGSWLAFHDDRMEARRACTLPKKSRMLVGSLLPRVPVIVAAMSACTMRAPPSSDCYASECTAEDALNRSLCFVSALGIWLLLSCGAALLEMKRERHVVWWAVALAAATGSAVAFVLLNDLCLDGLLGLMPVRSASNIVLLGMAVASAWSWLLHWLATLRVEPKPRSRCAKLRATRIYSNFWSRMIDLAYGLLILVLLVLCTALPLAMVQAVTLFNSSFLRFLSQRNRRGRVLNELLDVD